MLSSAFCKQEVGRAADAFRPIQIIAVQECPIVKTMQKVTANGQLFLKFGQSRFADVRIAVVFLVSSGIVVHSLFECRCDTHIIHHQPAFLVAEHTVYTGNSLHQVMSGHGLVDVHGGKRWHVKPREPHINDNGNFQGRGIIFEETRHMLFVGLISNDFSPFFRVIVPLRHDDCHLIRPVRTPFQYLVVNLHGNGACIGHYHGFACQQKRSVSFIMFKNIIN